MNSINAILPIIVTLSSLWVYVDASKNKIGNSPNGGLLNIGGAGWWGYFVCSYGLSLSHCI